MNPSRAQGYGQSPQAGQASPYNSNQASGYSGTNVSDQAGAQGSQGRGGSYNQGGDKQNQGGDEQQQSSEGDGSGYKADGAADQSKAVGKASPSASGVKVSKYPQDAQHSETMAALHKVARECWKCKEGLSVLSAPWLTSRQSRGTRRTTSTALFI